MMVVTCRDANIIALGRGRALCAGADLAFALDSLEETGRTDALLAFVERAGSVLDRVARFPRPVIAAVNGLALAGGLELVLCCDLVVAAESARIGDAHANYGLLPGAGGSVRLPRRIGATRAKRMLFTGDLVPAQELLEAGLVNAVVPDDELETAAMALAEAVSQKSPLSLAAMKKLVAEGDDLPLEEALRLELEALRTHLESYDVREGLTAFREKREPRFEGR